MGVSFKLSNIGRRYRPKLLPSIVAGEEAHDDEAIAVSRPNSVLSREEAHRNKVVSDISDRELSFTLSLFPTGYTVGKPVESESGSQTSIQVPKFLHPYDRSSNVLFSAIECGHLPGDILDNIPCKYFDGTVICEVRDYRNSHTESAHNMASGVGNPVVNRVCLRMSLENVVKDIPSISDDGWTYGDLMEVESRILKALQPRLHLDPTPRLDRLSDNLVLPKFNLGLSGMWRKRLRDVQKGTEPSNDGVHLKKVCADRFPQNSRLGDAGALAQPAHETLIDQNYLSTNMATLRNNSFGSDGSHIDSLPLSTQSNYQIGDGSPRNAKDHRAGGFLNMSAASPGRQGMAPFTDNGVNTINGKRENPDGQSSPLTNKKAQVLHTGVDGNVQHTGPHIDNLYVPDLHWKNTFMQQQQVARGIQYTNNGMQKFPQQAFEGGLIQEGTFSIGQQGLRYGLKEEPVETERLDKPELSHVPMGDSESTRVEPLQSHLQQRIAQQFMRPGFPQSSWNNLGQPFDNNPRKEDSFGKRKFVQSPRVSTAGLPQSPLSSKSGEFSSGSVGQFGAAVTSGILSSQKEKAAVTSVLAVAIGGNPSLASSANDSIQRQNQAQAAAKRRSSSLPRTPGMSGVGSPASVSNMSVPINANSPPVGNQPLADQIMLERFSKIEMVSMRCQLNRNRNKVEAMRKSSIFSAQQILHHLSSDSSNENFNDETCKMPLSKSLVGGNMNVLKTRILNFSPERVIQGNDVQFVPKARTRMIMSEKATDSVTYCIGEIEDGEYLEGEEYLPTLPNTHIADLLAAQYCSLMGRDGYHVEDLVQPKPVRVNHASVIQLNPETAPGGITTEMQRFSGVSSQLQSEITKLGNSANTSVNSLQSVQGTRILHPGNAQAMHISQGLLSGISMPSGAQQPEQPPTLQHQSQQQSSLMQQQLPQFQRSPMTLPANSIQHLNDITQNTNMQMGASMANKTSSIQLQMLQQQQLLQPQQQQSPIQRKMMSGIGSAGMGNIGNNMIGLGGLSNNGVGLGGVRGVSGSGISAQMGPISNVGNMSQNPMNLTHASNLSNALRSGMITPAHAAFLKMRMAQNRSNMSGSSQSAIGGMPGARQMLPGSAGLSMLGPALSRTNINQMQRAAMGVMAPPKLMPNIYMNQQQLQFQQLNQQLQLQQQQQQMQLQQQQMQQQQQQQQMQLQQHQLHMQQETASPLQSVVSSPQVGSPSNMGIPHQMNQPQHQQQQQPQNQQASPQQISQRTPMSPQLSSGAVHPISTGNPEACPASPQVSSQTLGSVGSMATSPMELQGGNKSNSANNA